MTDDGRDNIYVYLDYGSQHVVPGADVSVTEYDSTALEEFYSTTSRTLVALDASTSAEATYGMVSAKASMSLKTENEVTNVTTRKIDSIKTQLREMKFKMPADGASLGTVFFVIDMVVGPETVKVASSEPVFDLWTKEKLKQFDGWPMTQTMRTLINGLNGSTDPIKTRSSADAPRLFVMPIKGKTCHHVKFSRAYSDNCIPDNTHCLNLDGSKFVVCHHHDWKWIGGPSCDCNYVDGTNVRLADPLEVNPQYSTAKPPQLS